MLGMLASTKQGADILLTFEWESVRHARDRLDDARKSTDEGSWPVLGSLSDISNMSVPRDQQLASFIVATDNEISTSFAWRLRQNNGSSSRISSTHMADTHATWPRSILPSVREGFCDGSDHAEGFSAADNDFTISAPDEMDLKLSLGSIGKSSLITDNQWDISINNKQEIKCKSVNLECCTKSEETFQNVVSAQDIVPSSICTNDEHNLSSCCTSRQENYDVQPIVMCHTQSFSGFPVRSSLTLPHILCHEGTRQEHELEQQKPAKHPVSVQDLSGYLKLRDLHPPTMADSPSFITHHYVTCVSDAESYKTKSLDLRVSRLRFVAVLIIFLS